MDEWKSIKTRMRKWEKGSAIFGVKVPFYSPSAGEWQSNYAALCGCAVFFGENHIFQVEI